MATLKEERERAIASGDVRAAKFTGAVSSLDNLALEVGDEFVFPSTYEVFKSKRFNGAEYILVTLTNGQAKPFYPSTFTKRRMICNLDGTPTGERAVTKGTAAESFRTFMSVEKGMDALKGKKVKVSNIEIIDTLAFRSTDVVKAQIPTIDFVEEPAAE